MRFEVQKLEKINYKIIQMKSKEEEIKKIKDKN